MDMSVWYLVGAILVFFMQDICPYDYASAAG